LRTICDRREAEPEPYLHLEGKTIFRFMTSFQDEYDEYYKIGSKERMRALRDNPEADTSPSVYSTPLNLRVIRENGTELVTVGLSLELCAWGEGKTTLYAELQSNGEFDLHEKKMRSCKEFKAKVYLVHPAIDFRDNKLVSKALWGTFKGRPSINPTNQGMCESQTNPLYFVSFMNRAIDGESFGVICVIRNDIGGGKKLVI
jgi:hypothetical protein